MEWAFSGSSQKRGEQNLFRGGKTTSNSRSERESLIFHCGDMSMARNFGSHAVPSKEKGFFSSICPFCEAYTCLDSLEASCNWSIPLASEEVPNFPSPLCVCFVLRARSIESVDTTKDATSHHFSRLIHSSWVWNGVFGNVSLDYCCSNNLLAKTLCV